MNTAAAKEKVTDAEDAYRGLLTGMEQRIAALPDNASPADLDNIETEFRSQLDAAEASVESARRQRETFDTITEARAGVRHLLPSDHITVGSEPVTYNPHDPEGRSFFVDLFAWQKNGSHTALERLHRNNAEVAETRKRESRASLTTSDFYPPNFLSQEYVSTARPRMVYASLVQQLPLPPYGNEVTIPKYSGPSQAADFQAGDNSNITTNAGSTSQLTAPIALAAGYCDVALQAVERGAPGLDLVIWGDVSRDISHRIETGVLTGSGTDQPAGVLLDSDVTAKTVTGQTSAQFLLKLADIMQTIETNTGEPADFVLMAPRRWSWLASLVDSDGRPLVVPGNSGPWNAFGVASHQTGDDVLSNAPDVQAKGYVAGLPIFTSASIPSNYGSGTNEDWCLVGVRDLAVRWADPQGIRTVRFDAVASSTASVRLMALTYSAYITRYPSAFGVIKGMTTPGF